MEADSRLTALIAQFIDLVSTVLLLGWQMRIFSQQFISSCSERTENGCWLGFGQLVGLRRLIGDGLINGFAGMALFAGNLPLAFAVEVVGPTNGFAFLHGHHLQ